MLSSQRLKDFLQKASLFVDLPLSNSVSDEDFVKISQQDILGEGEDANVALPTMGTNFMVN